MAAEQVINTVEQVAEAAKPMGEQVKEMILHHITNGYDWQLPATQIVFPSDLLRFELVGIEFNLSITRHVLMMLIAAAILVLLGLLVRRRLSLIPKGLASVVEAFVLYVRNEIAVPTMGKKGAERYTSYLCSVFFFILVCNLLGLIPYGSTATGNISVTAALAFSSFVMIQVAGIRKMGVLGYFGHLVPQGVPWWLSPVMVVVELMGILAKPFALCVRLFANMLAGHVVILSLIGCVFVMGWVIVPVSIGFGVFMYFLEIFVAFLQAYVFTMLTSLFIGLMVAEHH